MFSNKENIGAMAFWDIVEIQMMKMSLINGRMKIQNINVLIYS
jgi:hypothetical protein